MRLTAHIGLLTLGATALLLACTSGSGSTSLDGGAAEDGGTIGNPGTPQDSGTSGSSDAAVTGVVPQAIVRATLLTGSTGTCSVAGNSFAIGSFSPITAAKPGDADPAGGTVDLSCSVLPAAASFDVSVTFSVATGGAGSLLKGFSMTGSRTSTGTSDGTATVGFALPKFTFGATDCTFDPGTVTGGVGGIAAGRYWTSFHCTGASRANSSDLCDIDGEVRVENCLQK
jgi:hypothetical protein